MLTATYDHVTTRIKLSRINDGINKPFICRCGKSYIKKGSLNRHLKEECGKDPKHTCYICKKRFHQKANFVRHNLTVHGRLYVQSAHD